MNLLFSHRTPRGSAAADSGKTRRAKQNYKQAKRATHIRAEGGRLQPLVMPPSREQSNLALD